VVAAAMLADIASPLPFPAISATCRHCHRIVLKTAPYLVHVVALQAVAFNIALRINDLQRYLSVFLRIKGENNDFRADSVSKHIGAPDIHACPVASAGWFLMVPDGSRERFE
jgi:hypothetical protein